MVQGRYSVLPPGSTLTIISLQVAESVFPYREKQTQEEELLEEVEYYIRMVSSAMYRNRHSDGEDSETGDITGPSHDGQEMNKEGDREEVADYDSSQVLVPLKKIMSFKKVENLCSDPGILRYNLCQILVTFW